MPLYRKYINSRADFLSVLAELIRQTEDLVRTNPGYPPFVSIERQLKGMQAWTANGRDPTREERKRINYGQLLVREFEPAPNDEMYHYTQKLYELSEAFREWWTDEQRATLNEEDLPKAWEVDE